LNGPRLGSKSNVAIGAFFILVIVLIVLAALGGGVYAIAMWLRHKQLDPEGDKVEEAGEQARARPRSEHVEHGKAQRARFIGGR
jgi:flagellar basal body-associated protein FliL